jgi:H+/Cl- antiporter ClcA
MRWVVVVLIVAVGVGSFFLYGDAVTIFSGSREFDQWMFWTLTNKSVLFYVCMTAIGGCVGWLFWWFALGGKRSGRGWNFLRKRGKDEHLW